MIKFTAKDDGTDNGTSHTLKSGMSRKAVPFWREVEEGNFFYFPNPTDQQHLNSAKLIDSICLNQTVKSSSDL